MKKVLFLMLLFLIGVTVMNAQVTIGNNKDAEVFSILELVSNGSNGLRLPQLTEAQRDSISLTGQPLSMGLVIYNTDAGCMDYWNGLKWVSLCLGTAGITLTGDSAGVVGVYDPTNPPVTASSGDSVPWIYTPKSNPVCLASSGRSYQVYLTAGIGYASLRVDNLTSAFSVSFQSNNSANSRIAVVHVVDNCSGEFRDFVFVQNGAACPNANPFTLQKDTTGICGDNGSVIAWVASPQSGIDYFWEYAGVVVNTGNYMEITHAGTYTVYAGLIGCTTPTPQTLAITQSDGSSPPAPFVSASNSGSLCSSGQLILTAYNVVAGSVLEWYQNGSLTSYTNNPLSVSGSSAAGEWFVVQRTAGCASRASNKVVLTDNTSIGTVLDTPVAMVNGTPLDGSTPPVICGSGTLELRVSNTYPDGTIFEWFDNGISLARTADPVIYAIAPNRESIILSIEVSNNSGSCPATASSQEIEVTLTSPAPTSINNGAEVAAICGSTPAILQANNSAGVFYQWFLDGVSIGDSLNASYLTSTPGLYRVRYQDSVGCWSQVSEAIRVIQSAAINMAWLVAPKDTVTVDDNESYTVLTSLTPDAYVWTSSDPTIATVTPIDGGRSVSVNYIKIGTVNLTVEASNCCGTVWLEKTVVVIDSCMPIMSVNLIPAGTVNKNLNVSGEPKTPGDGSTVFTATATNGSPATSYEWFINGVLQTGQTSATFTYKTATSGSYSITARAYNGCTGTPGSNNGALSATTVVKVTQDASPDVSGNYSLNGKTCFDVNRGNNNASCMPRASRRDAFASTKSFSYTFSSPTSSLYTNLSFSVVDNNVLLASTSVSGSVFTITFKDNISALVAGTDKITARKLFITAQYTDNLSNSKQITLEVSVQDCSCGCSVKLNSISWLTFMCYNLGVPEATKNWTIAQQMAYNTTGATDMTVYGGLWQWGRRSDGHQSRASASVAGSYSGSFDVNGQVPSSATAYYGNFIMNSSSPYDWRNPQNASLWGSNKTANDPCPSGWRIPTWTEWTSVFKLGLDESYIAISSDWKYLTNDNNKVRWSKGGTKGIEISTNDSNTTTLFLPAAGYRSYSNGTFSNAGSYGYYWSSTATNSKLNNFIFSNTMIMYPIYYLFNYRANGNSIRCVAE